MHEARQLTISKQRLRWLLRQDPCVSWLWLRINDWRVPTDPEKLLAFSDVLCAIQREFYPLETCDIASPVPLNYSNEAHAETQTGQQE